ncbi:MAG: phosphoesterase [Gammaproteobacteria bacterium RIFCSPLOWO2_02_FULL_42_14]|nr:MAG: phosphoesterase [Gammaproteobacteria bacterium RIFCSPHIGHO2_02_FULL_42_43]OGT53386.1 MAG: phosphoesterase [Gammaproteobacteria bacterium RIFCSPHIGHO2_12_FULL_41_25]OGT63418.1 MAG: phosphoesterase [Gammaproteobacteria bacterium RIFCSPLOWO2_02_FULL_42_14]OGT87344.1 MAG: phosphoesterase [Gammaproteobacteria bacterium RIFCSPLOWO2_12_FULL_42_18]
MAYHQRGLDSAQEQDQSRIIRDTRTLGMRIADTLKNPIQLAIILFVLMLTTFVVGYISELILLMGVGCFLYGYFRHHMLPFRLPLFTHQKDYNDLIPGTIKPRMARGIYYFGNEIKTSDELWFSNEDMRTHVLIFGSTGSGKTEALLSLAYNALLQASGFIYVDGKGDNNVYVKIFSMVRSMGRDDDLLLINFMTGARDVIGPQEARLSNTLNPFGSGSSSMLSNLVVSLMGEASASSDGDMWKGRAIGFVEALMKVLVAMRDAGCILLDANTVRNYFHLPKLESIVLDKVFPRDGMESVSLENFPPVVFEALVNYVITLPGYKKENKGKQVSQVFEQHGYITMQLVRVFTSLADTYGHILRTRLPEVDLSDIVLNRRILCVLLPALEKSPDELSNLGKIIIATLKSMMAAGLGDTVEGTYKDLVEKKPTNAETPFLCVLDEYGYYAVKGFAVVPAQARSLGFSVVFAGQDLPAFQKASKEEAASIGANTNIKVCMKLEDPTETWDFFMKTAGEAYVTHVESFQVDQGSVLGTYADAKGARLEKRARVDLLDLKEQREGEAHFFFKSKVVRGKFFYANPAPVKRMHLNNLLMVDPPTDDVAKQILKSFENVDHLSATMTESLVAPESEEIERVAVLMQTYADLPPIERAIQVLQHFEKKHEAVSAAGDDIPEDFFHEVSQITPELSSAPSGMLNIFMPLRYTDHLKQLQVPQDVAFTAAILNRKVTSDQIEYIQRLCGQSGKQASKVAIELVSDMDRGTEYPPKLGDAVLTAPQVTQKVKDIIAGVVLKKKEKST